MRYTYKYMQTSCLISLTNWSYSTRTDEESLCVLHCRCPPEGAVKTSLNLIVAYLCVCVCVCVCVCGLSWFAGSCVKKLLRVWQKNSLFLPSGSSSSNISSQVSLFKLRQIISAPCLYLNPPQNALSVSCMCVLSRQTKIRWGAVVWPPEEHSGRFAETWSCTENQWVCWFSSSLYPWFVWVIETTADQ